MGDRQSPLQSIAINGRFGAEKPDPVPLSLSQRLPGALYQIAGWGDFETATGPILSSLGLDSLGNSSDARSASGIHCFRIAPDRLWLLAEAESALQSTPMDAPSDRLAVLDLSHSRCIVDVSGAASEDLLARVAALDFSIPAFPVGTFAQTGIHQISVLIHRVGEVRFDILTPVTWAVSLWEWLCLNAEPFGYNVGTDAP
jgi:sarcosine oxidase subunit gamma